jgi:hypothetical protein
MLNCPLPRLRRRDLRRKRGTRKVWESGVRCWREEGKGQEGEAKRMWGVGMIDDRNLVETTKSPDLTSSFLTLLANFPFQT